MIEMAGCVMTNADQHLLLLHRRAIDRWDLPGGKVEPGEEITNAAVREANEELGVVIDLGDPLGSANFYLNNQDYHYNYFRAKTADIPMASELNVFDDVRYHTRDNMYHLERQEKLSVFALYVLKSGWLEE